MTERQLLNVPALICMSPCGIEKEAIAGERLQCSLLMCLMQNGVWNRQAVRDDCE